MQKELEAYCRTDVRILVEGCMKFRDIFMEATKCETIPGDKGVDCFKDCITIAMACSVVYRRNFMPENTIALIPADAYVSNTRQSYKALQWFHYLEKTKGINLQHYGKGKEVRIAGYLVDGFDEENNTIYSFLGDYWHGNPAKYRGSTLNTRLGRDMNSIYLDTLDRERKLRQAGYTVISMWEKDFDIMMKKPEVQEVLKDFQYSEPLNPRDAFYGGRTGACKLYQKAGENQKIKYQDYVSLYPSVLFKYDYPIGRPEIITQPDDQDISSYFGIAKVTVKAPKSLLHPVLPIRCNNKLLFSLCYSCAEHNTRDINEDEDHVITQCKHSDADREWIGTYATCELEKAVEKGYVIKRIHQVWHFGSRSNDLFKGYVSSFLRYKQEASGYPKGCDTAEQRREYVDEYRINQGIQLRPERIRVNPGLKKTAKIALNSFYGKWGQRSNLPTRTYVASIGKFWYYLESEEFIVHDCRVISDHCMEISLTRPNEFVLPAKHTNVVIAAWTTALARLELYKLLETCQERALYHDTDSIIFLSDNDREELDPPLGPYLGDLTNEIDDIEKNDYISEFISAGSKNYAFKLANSGKTVVKCRGFTLNWEASQQIHFDSMKAMVLGEGPKEIVVRDDCRIVRDMETLTIHNRSMDKKIIPQGFQQKDCVRWIRDRSSRLYKIRQLDQIEFSMNQVTKEYGQF